MYSAHAVNGITRSAPETRCRIETHPGTGRRIWNRMAGRLRYFGRIFFAEALAIESARALLFTYFRAIDYSGQRTLNGALYGLPNETPATTVWYGRRCTLPWRSFLRVSTKRTGPSTSSRMETSPGAPSSSVPSFGNRPMTRAGLTVAMATTCSSVKPRFKNLLITHVRYGIPGVLPEKTWMSEEMVSGGAPCAIAGSAIV